MMVWMSLKKNQDLVLAAVNKLVDDVREVVK